MIQYPTKRDFQIFIEVLREGDHPIKKYLPPINEGWYEAVSGCSEYVRHTSHYESLSFVETCAYLLYKVAKRHELGDGNKRSSVMAVFLLCLVNDYYILDPAIIKQQAKRVASTKGRHNERLLRKRVAVVLERHIIPMPKTTAPT